MVAVVLLGSGAVALAHVETSDGRSASNTFNGTGDKTLPAFRTNKPSMLYWEGTGAIFQIFGSGLGGGDVNSQAASGVTYVAPGRHSLHVYAIGSWAVRVVPGVLRPQKIPGDPGYVGYTGNGGLDVPPFRLPRSEEVLWACNGSTFQTVDTAASIGVQVNSSGHKGAVYADAGTHELVVTAVGNWAIAWRQ